MKLKEPIAMLKPSEQKMGNKPSKKRQNLPYNLSLNIL